MTNAEFRKEYAAGKARDSIERIFDRLFGIFEAVIEGDFEAAVWEKHYYDMNVPNAVVGAPATLCLGSDNYPMTVVEVSATRSKIVCRRDKVHKGKSKLFEPDPKGEVVVARLRRDGDYRTTGTYGCRVVIGERSYYRDPHI